MARPSIYSDELVTEICSRLAAGQPLTKICQDENMPGTTTVYRWLSENQTFRDIYARAREDQADTLADEIIAISDKQQEIVKEDGSTYDPDVNRDRLRVDARKWIAAKLKPKKYGDKQELEHTGNLAINLVSYGKPDNPV